MSKVARPQNQAQNKAQGDGLQQGEGLSFTTEVDLLNQKDCNASVLGWNFSQVPVEHVLPEAVSKDVPSLLAAYNEIHLSQAVQSDAACSPHAVQDGVVQVSQKVQDEAVRSPQAIQNEAVRSPHAVLDESTPLSQPIQGDSNTSF
ncbi:unnamed protein product [Ilex paraguariensis]|uniref:Uncharacterized protein n=1 Tax=Ilex paraguariensis TaxID=185542 RepID=A0ABC8SHB0_9AQUA